ncbi:hypothetical protein [Herbiconiux liukaitaii]|uniref:hypothetical protein n=1 Tax=Herbiconiux liukaitaii TaxID=3342799 RepID=UPI0035B6C47B
MTDKSNSEEPTAPGADGPNLGGDGTIPNSDTGIALGHDPDGSHFNPEEEDGDAADTADDTDGAE